MPPEDVVVLDTDPRIMSHAELQALFPCHWDAVSDAALIGSILWWLRGEIAAGREPPVDGNLRTLWYRYVKPVLAGLPGARVETGYTRLIQVLADLVLRRGDMRYADFDLTDENWEHRRIGATRPEVILYAEQSAWMRDLRRAHEDFGCTVVCWQGQPSGVTSEFTARHVLEALPAPRPAHLVSLADWDPAGDIITAAFEAQLRACGLEVASNHRLVTPDCFTPAERELHAAPLPNRGGQVKIVAGWMERRGGVDGHRAGLSSEVLSWDRLRPRLADHLATLPGVAHA